MGDLWFHCKNVRIHTPARLANLLKELEGLAWNVICFSETRAASDDVILSGGHRLISELGVTPYAGVAVFLHACLVDKVKRIHRFSGRVLAVDVDIGPLQKLRIISVYAPHCGYDRGCLDNFYNDLQTAHNDYVGAAKACGRPIIIGSDFNSQLGIGIRGELLSSSAVWNGLLVANGMTCENGGDSWTFESTMGIRRRIDFMLLSQNCCLFAANRRMTSTWARTIEQCLPRRVCLRKSFNGRGDRHLGNGLALVPTRKS